MKLLAFDTSTPLASIALYDQGEILVLEQTAQGQHAQFILKLIEQVLSDAALSPQQLDGIIFGRGPGSFTGLRVACSVAQGLAYPYDLPVYPVSSLATITHEIRLKENNLKLPVLAMIDARMNQVYWAYYPELSYEVEESVSAAQAVTIQSTASLALVGIGYESYYPLLPKLVQQKIVKQHSTMPHAKTMLDFVLSQKTAPISPEEARPVYIRNQVTST